MNLPLTSWNKTLKALGYKVVRNPNKNRQRAKLNDQAQYEKLEPRQMLAGDTGLVVQANLDQILSTVDNPLVSRLGQFDANASSDLAILSANGQLTIATNGDNDSWQTNQTVDLNVGSLHGIELALVNDDGFADLILQGPDNIFVAINDGDGRFSIEQTLTPFAGGEMSPGAGSLRMATGDFNGDFVFDVAALAPGVDQLVVYLGVGDGTFDSPIIESTGGVGPTSIVSGDFIRDAYPDLAIGHADGTITFLQNQDGASFTQRGDLTVGGFSAITDLAAADVNGDGDTDIVVASGDQITILNNEKAELSSGPVISNGGFGLGLQTWNVEVVGHRVDSVSGTVIAQSGFAQLVENESFLVSVNQDFVVPDNPQTIEVDLLSIGLEDPAGGIPDAFEISILDDNGNSLVPTFRPDATSFFNVNPGDVVEMATGVTFDGTTVSVDISSISVGSEATIYFDLIGNGPGNGSTVTIDNVRITPDEEFDSSFTPTTLTGPFVNANQLAIDDVDGDGRLDILATDEGNDKLLVFNGKPDGTFEREEIDLSGLGTGLVSLDTAPLSAGDSVSDIVVIAGDSNVAISPLSSDTTAPTATLLSPIANQTNTGSVSQVDIQFDELMRDFGPADSMSVTNPNNYTVTFLGSDGLEGTADDQTLAITDINYEPLTGVVSIEIDPASTPLEDGIYVVTLDSSMLKDQSDNLLADGQPVEFEFTMNSDGPVIDPIDPLESVEGGIVEMVTGFSDAGGAIPYEAQIDWGDGSVTSVNMVNFSAGVGTLAANHIYADDGTYDITLTVEDAQGIATQAFTTAVVTNADPNAIGVTTTLDAVRNQQISQVLANFSDFGFDNINTGTTEWFTASIDWGDGTTTNGVVDSTSGMPGTPTAGTVFGEHTYSVVGQFTITITVTDDDGGSDAVQIFVNVESDAPEFSVVSTVAGDEGELVSLNASFTDNDVSGTYLATIDWGDGNTSNGVVSYASGSGTITGDHSYADNGTYVVTVQVTDPAGNSGAGTANAYIANVDPSIDPIADQSTDVATTFALPQIQFDDPGFSVAGVSEESFVVSIDWGDGNVTTDAVATVTPGGEGVSTVGVADASHIYNVPGLYDVVVTVTDDDGGFVTETLQVSVNSVAPVLGAVDPVSGNEGESISLDVGFTDPRTTETYTATVDWGDGTTTNAIVSFANSVGAIASEHVYADNGSYNVAVSLTDASSQVVNGSTIATIENVAPTLQQPADVTIDVGAPLLLEDIEFTDSGFTSGTTVETFDATVDWGDGNTTTATVTVTPGSEGVLSIGLIDATYTFGMVGVYAATITLTDDDGGVATVTFDVNVEAIPGGGKASTRFFVVDKTADAAFRYDPQGNATGNFATTGSNNARGATTWTTGNPLYVIDHDRRVYVYDSDGETLLGSWSAGTINNPEGIATDGVSIWIVDKSKKRVYFYQNAASLRSGSLSPTSSFKLNNQNKNPAGLTTDGNHLWVVDQTDDSVYVYNMNGSLDSNWNLDASNRNARGITIDPTGGDGIWVVDKVDNRVYEYAMSLPTGNSQSATGWFALDPGNKNPEGIADPVTSINYGDTIVDSIGVVGEVDDWQFNGTAGESIYLNFESLSGGQVIRQLIAPDGSIEANINTTNIGLLDVEFALDQTGVYTIRVQGNASDLPAYQFTLHDITVPNATTISVGDTASGVNDFAGQKDVWEFPVVSGQIVFVDFQSASAGFLNMKLVDPDGDTVLTAAANNNANALDRGPLTLTKTGTYQLFVDPAGDQIISYQFELFDVPSVPPVTILIGDTVNDSVIAPFSFNTYEFVSTGTESVFFDFQQLSGGSLATKLTDPNGATVFTRGSNGLGTNPINILDVDVTALTVAGIYSFTTDPSGFHTTAFQFELVNVPTPTPTTILIGDVVTDSIGAQGSTNIYEFVSNGTETVYFDFQAHSGGTLFIDLVDPDGDTVFTDGSNGLGVQGPNQLDNGEFALTKAGTYVFTVDASGAATPAYQFELVNVPTPPPTTISIGDTINDAIGGVGEKNVYEFTATDADIIFFDFNAQSGGTLLLELKDPDGDTIFTDSSNGGSVNGPNDLDNGAFVLTKNGTYTFIVDGAGDLTPAFEFELVSVPAPDITNLVFDQQYSGTTSIAGEWDEWVIPATAGDVGFMDIHRVLAPSIFLSSTNFILFAPDGSTVYSKSSDSAPDSEDTLVSFDQTGDYRLVVTGLGAQLIDYDFTFWYVDADVPISVGINETVENHRVPTQTLTYELNATTGDDLVFAITRNNNVASFFTLTSPTGQVIFQDQATGYVIPTLIETGTYTLTVVTANGGDFDLNGAFGFRFQTPFVVGVAGDQIDSQGTEFWLSFPRGFNSIADNATDFELHITSAVDTLAMIEIPGLSDIRIADVKAGEVSIVPLPRETMTDLFGESTSNKGINVYSQHDVSVYGLSHAPASTDAYLALPVDALGTEYMVLAYPNTGLTIPFVSQGYNGSQFTVVAQVDNTVLTITPATAINSHPAGVPFNITLNRGEVYQLAHDGDLGDTTGTVITASSAVAVFGSHRCARIPSGFKACDHLVEQLPPTSAWGTRFATVPLALRNGGDTFRFVAAADNTSIVINGTTVATIDSGESYSQFIDGNAEITTSNPVLVAQYSNGSEFDGVSADPFMMLVTPIEQYQTSYTISTLEEEVFFNGQFANIVASPGAVASLTVDGVLVDANLFTPIGPGLLGAQIPLGEGSFNLASNLPFGISVYGFGFFDSYGYPGGNSIAPIAEVASIDTTPDTFTANVSGSHTVSTLVLDDNGQPVEGVLINYSVIGVNPQTNYGITDANGIATYTYSGFNAGTDSIVSFIGNLSDIVTVDWQGIEPTVTITAPAPGSLFQTGQTVLVSGRAIPGAPEAEIVNVTINGQQVQSIDAAGNYFGFVTISGGSQSYQVIATDVLGGTATAAIALEGTSGSTVNVAELQATAKDDTTFSYARTSFNRLTSQLNVDYTVTNNGLPTINGGSLAVFGGFDPVSVAMDGADGQSAGADYFVLDSEIPAAGLITGDTSVSTHIVFDNQDRSRFDFAAFVLIESNLAPYFDSAPVVVASATSPYAYDASATDPNGQAVVYSLVAAPDGMTIDPSTGIIAWTPGATDVAQHAIQIQADDGEGGTAVQSFTLSVTDPIPSNRAPVFVTPVGDTLNLNGQGGSVAYQFQAMALDPENDTLIYSVSGEPAGLTINPASGLIDWTVTNGDLGSYGFDVIATDSAGNVTTQAFTLAVVDQVTGSISGLVFEDQNNNGSNDGEPGLGGRTVFLDANANNQLDAGEVTATTAVDGTFAFSGLLAGTYAVGQVLQTGFDQTTPVGTTQAVVVAAGGNSPNVDFGNFDNGNTNNSAPVITSSPTESGKVNNDYQYQLSATDADGDTLNFSLLNAPDGMTVDPASGLIGWTPTADQQSFHDVLVQVDDGNGNLGLQAFNVLIRPEFQAPSITSSPIRVASVGDVYEYLVTAEDPDEQLLTYGLASAPVGASMDPVTGLITWSPAVGDIGTADFEIEVFDEDNLIARQSFTLSVRDVNVAPVFTSAPIVEAAAGAQYLYTAIATDTEDAVTYSLIDGPAGMFVNGQSGLVAWTSSAADLGSNVNVTIRATDERGLSADQTFTLAVLLDSEAPDVQVLSNTNILEVGETATISIAVSDNVEVDTLVVTIDGVVATLTQLGANLYETTFTSIAPGLPTIVATATDAAGNVGTDQLRLRTIDPTDVTAPIVEINSPAINSSVTYLTDVAITVLGSDLDTYTLEYSPRGTENWVTLDTGIVERNNEIVATFDPTLLQNDQYDLRITAFDFSGNIATETIFVSVEGQAKLGNYALDFVDLAIPLAGIPIQIIRQYDTLNANQSGDFGYGWNLSIGEARIRETLGVTQAELDGVPPLFGGAEAFFAGARVYVTTPEGQRVGFTFEPEAQGGFLGTIFTPKFTADVDTDYELEVPFTTLSQNGDGTFGLYLFGGNYNPREYTLVSKDQIRYTYDQFEDLKTVTDRNDVTLEYRDDGIFSSTGESIQFVRDAQGRIKKIIDPAGNSLLYDYDAAGDLISQTDQVMLSTTMTYNDENPHYLETITGPRGNLINEVKYDEDGRFVGLVDALGNEVVQDYDLETNTFVQTDRNGNPTTLIYDDRGNITEERDALGNSEFSEYNDPRHAHLETAITNKRGFTTNYTYDARGNVTLLEEPGGVFTRFEYDSFNNVTRTIGPALTDPGDGFADTLIDSFFADGVILATTIEERLADEDFTEVNSADLILGPEYDRDTETPLDSDYVLLANVGDYVTVGFNEIVEDRDGDDIFIVTPRFSGHLVDQGEMADVSVTTDGVNYVSVGQIGLEPYAGVDLADAGIMGQVLGIRITALANSGAGNDVFAVTAVQAISGDFRTTRNIYDEHGNLVESVDALGNSQFQTTDSYGRPLSITDQNGNTTAFEYAQLIGSPTKVINPDLTFQSSSYTDLGDLTSQTNELGIVVTTAVYNDAGRRIEETGADGQVTEYEYDADLLVTGTVSINPTESRATTYQYDEIDRLLLQTDANAGEIELAYDANGNLLSLKDPVGNETSYVYNELNLLIQEIDPLSGSITYDYDPNGNVVERVDRLDRRIEFVYNAMNRLTDEFWYANDGSLVQTSTYSYDISGNLLTANDPNSNYVLTYDAFNRLIMADNTGTTGSPNVVLSYAYDEAGNQIQVADNTGVTTDFEYGNRNELLSKTWHGGEVDDARVEFDYDAAGRETDTRRYSDVIGDGTTSLIGRSETVYDDSGRVVRVTHLDGSNVVLANYEFDFDFANQISHQTIDANDVAYTYDATGQLTGADNSDPTVLDEFYVYDLNGNRIESHEHGSDYVLGANNRLVSDGEFNYEYDAENNQTRKINIATGEVTEYEYDHRNHMVRATVTASGSNVVLDVEFVYDAFGRRIATITDADGDASAPATSEIYVYDGDNAWVDFNENGQSTARYLFGNAIDSNIARWRTTEGTGWYLTDHLGSVGTIIDATGIAINQISYDSFGEVQMESSAVSGDRYKFTGREWNSDLAVYYNRARIYQPSIGRFLSQDPIRFSAGDANLHRYVSNSPLTATDPLGLATMTESTVQNLMNKPILIKTLTASERAQAAQIAQQTINRLAAQRAALNPGVGGQFANVDALTKSIVVWKEFIIALFA